MTTFNERSVGVSTSSPGVTVIPHSHRARHGLIALTALALLAACSEPPAAPEEIRAVRTLVVQPGPVEARNTYAGEVRPRYESNLGFRVAGKIEARLVNVGDRVRRGDLLMRLDARDLALTEASSRATVAAQDAQFAVEKADFERFEKLAATGFISAAEFDRQKTRYEAARAQLESVRAQARVSGNQTGYAELRADADGTITALDADAGQVVGAGQIVARLARSGTIEVAANVPELLVQRLKVGQPVEVMLWTSGDAVYPGRIRELAQSADPATRTYALRVSVDEPPARMQLGMTASIRIVDAAVPSLFHLPMSAWIESGGQQGVWIHDAASGSVVFRPLRLVGFEGNLALVGEGLAPGERVVTAGASLLRDGQKVRLLAEATAPAAPAAHP
jgi:multidrug efflux system membrane fusion protein